MKIETRMTDSQQVGSGWWNYPAQKLAPPEPWLAAARRGYGYSFLTSSKWGIGSHSHSAFRRDFLLRHLTNCVSFVSSETITDAMVASKNCPQKRAFKGRPVVRGCLSINSLRAKCPGTPREIQVLCFQRYCIPPAVSGPPFAGNFGGTDIKTACRARRLHWSSQAGNP